MFRFDLRRMEEDQPLIGTDKLQKVEERRNGTCHVVRNFARRDAGTRTVEESRQTGGCNVRPCPAIEQAAIYRNLIRVLYEALHFL